MQPEPQNAKLFIIEPKVTISGRHQTHLLCVDDEEAMAYLTAQVLANKGYRVTALCDPRRALKIFRKVNIELAIVDYQMPEMSGTSLAAQLKRARSKVKIVLFTGALNIPASDVLQVDAVVGKAEGVQALLQTVDRLLAQA